MRCYYHEDNEAVGTCKSCGKGLCRACAVDLTKGLACRGHCEADAQALIQLIDRNIQLMATSSRVIQSNRSVRLGASVFHIAIGAVFAGWGLHDGISLIIVLGFALIAYGVYLLFMARKIGSPKQT